MSKEELLKYLIAEIDLIMHDKDYRFENQDGTWYSRESCRDLTNEEVFEELKSELMQLNSQVEKIADLEAKLAESESELEKQKEKYDKLYECYKKTSSEDLQDKYRLAEENDQLKQQLAEKETRIAELEDKDWYEGTIKQLEEQNERLLNKLAEKEEEIKQLNNRILLSQLQAPKEQILNILGSQCIQCNPEQDKISFAVERLLNVRSFICDCTEIKEPDYTKVCDFIDNQIKQLKEGK